MRTGRADQEAMGEHIDKLIALSAVEHVKAYTKADGTHVAAHTRVGGKFTVALPDGTMATRNSKTHDYTHAVMVKGNKESDRHGIYRWSGSMKAAQAGVKEAQRRGYTDTKIVSVSRVEGTGSAPKAPAGKATDKEVPSAVETLKAKIEAPKAGTTVDRSVRYDVGRKHPKPQYEVGDESPQGRVKDRTLKRYSDGSYHWEYYIKGKNGTVKAHEL